MSLIRINPHVLRKASNKLCKYSTTQIITDIEYTATPNYPKIVDLSPRKVLERKKEKIYDEIKAVKTVEEKQIKLNMPRYYGFKCYKFVEDYIPYNNLNLAQHITRTHLIQSETLPEYYNTMNVDSLATNVKALIEEALNLELERNKEINGNKDLSKQEVEDFCTKNICKHINRLMMNNMAQDCGHLMESQVDHEPRIEAFWFCGGMNPPKNIKRCRAGHLEALKIVEDNEPTDRAIQYVGKPVLTLRNSLPLKPLMKYEDCNAENLLVPNFELDPRTVGTKTNFQHGINIPGFWPGDPFKFGLISYHKRGHLIDRRYNDPEDCKEALHVQGMLASHAWLSAQANFLGFTTFNEITYPLVTQTIVTNGQLWSLYSYQLNTLLMYGRHSFENPKVNICWATPELKLFEEYKDGKFIGFNEEVLKKVMQYYANAPEERLGLNMRPYLSQQEKFIADYEEDEKRMWLEREYKHLMANKPRLKLPYEIYHWEKIYKIDFKTRPMEKRTRPFELFEKPFDRTLDDRFPKYIPRALRPHLKRNKGRYAKEYFP